MVSLMDNPKITVLMPIYNGEKYLQEAIESILIQTFNRFEFLIIDDGSKDNSSEIIQSYADERIRYIINRKKLGIPESLNKGLQLAQGEYIAHMDCDDISHPKRLEKQVRFMDAHPNVGVCGTWVKVFGKLEATWKFPKTPNEIMASLFFFDPLAHSSTISRLKMLREYNLFYDKAFNYAEDYDLWVRCARHFELANLDQVLLYYRVHEDQIGNQRREEQHNYADQIRMRQLYELGLSPNSKEVKIHKALTSMNFKATKEFIEDANEWLLNIKFKNDKAQIYSNKEFSMVIANNWFEVCNAASSLGLWTLKFFFKSQLSNYAVLSKRRKIEFAIKCGLRY